MARFYANENFPLPVVEELRRLGHDVLTIQETGQAGHSMSDEAVMAFAFQEKRILLTYNRKHFIRFHNQQYDHCGIVACTVDMNFFGLAHRIHQSIEKQENSERVLIRVNRPSA
ncbi:MAG: hypothetical protein C4527_21445 [Candidatus Omnitrophota bacterium]|jgi:uncharacterized protein with PIN domain|nr:MAG: hypothetical protein C4527_21445 [Candidatus Omnitrophota bacterium]